MMAIDQRQIDIAIASAPSEEHCRAIDKVLAERRRIERLRATAAVRMQDDSPWLILRTRVGRELSVCEALEVTNIEALVPMKMGPRIRRNRREIEPRKMPVMVGYMLARCPITNGAIAALLSFNDVSEVLGGYENPYLVDASKVRNFNEKAVNGEFDHEKPISLFGHLRKVRIIEGPFAGFVGEVVTSVGKGKGTAVIEIQFMNQPMPMIVPLAFLSPL